MSFDEILDFLFHRIAGIIFMIAAAFIAIFAMSGCFPADCLACYCDTMSQTMCGSKECNETCEDCYLNLSDECDGVCHSLFSCLTCNMCEGLMDCLFEDGCTSSCGDCVTVCGGANITCWQALCENGECGLCPSCGNDSYGNKNCTLLNCTMYCGGYHDGGYDDGYYDDDYYEDDSCDSCGSCDCGGCDGGSSGSSGSGSGGGGGSTYIRTMYLYDAYGNIYREYSVYDTTYSLPFEYRSGYEFRGYYSEPNGLGYMITDGTGYIHNKNYTYAYAYYVPLKTYQTNTLEIYVNGSYSTYYTITEGDEFYSYYIRYFNSEEEFRLSEINIEYLGNVYTVYSKGNTYYDTFRPSDFGIGSGATMRMNILTELKFFVYAYGYNSFGEFSAYAGTTVGDVIAEINPEEVHGYEFVGYASYAGASPDDVYAESEYVQSGMKFYPVYARTATVTFKDDSGSRTETYYVNGSIDFAPPANIPVGKTFLGWTPEDLLLGDGTSVAPGTTYSGMQTVTTKFDGVTFTPVWQASVYQITYYVNNSVYSYDNYTYGNAKTLLDTIDVKFFDFGGWSATNGGNVRVDMVTDTDTGNKEYYAILTPKTYTVSLDTSGGSISSYTVDVSYGSKAGVYSIPVPSRTGYDFGGWYFVKNGQKTFLTDNSGKTLLDFCAATFGVHEDSDMAAIQLVADWNVETYTVTFKVNGETYHTEFVEHGLKVERPADPTVKGYTLDYWSIFGNEFSFDDPVMADLELIAVLKPIKYNVILKVKDNEGYLALPGTDGWVPIGFSEGSFSYNYGDTTLIWETLFEVYDNAQSRDTFAGWAYNGKIIIDKDGNVDVDALASITVDETYTITLTAVFN